MLVQERIPGVALTLAWKYLSAAQKHGFKRQARKVLSQLRRAKTAGGVRGYVVPDPDPVGHRGIQELERDITLSDEYRDPNVGFINNDFNLVELHYR